MVDFITSAMRGKTFVFTDPLSNTGRLVPAYMLAKIHETPDTFSRGMPERLMKHG